jgi:hypothetical protein
MTETLNFYSTIACWLKNLQSTNEWQEKYNEVLMFKKAPVL